MVPLERLWNSARLNPNATSPIPAVQSPPPWSNALTGTSISNCARVPMRCS
jgi:hypothetical protein